MGKLARKILVLLPVMVLGIFYLHDRYNTRQHIQSKRLLFLALTILLLYGWIFLK